MTPIIRSAHRSTTKTSARRENACEEFRQHRVPKYLGYFERLLEPNGGPFLVGRRVTYADLSLFEIVAALRTPFPSA